MLFRSATIEAISKGHVTLAFRRWDKPRVKPGSEIRSALGAIGITSIEPVSMNGISEADARKAGHETHAALWAELNNFGTGQVYRMGVRFMGNDPRPALRETLPDAADDAEIARRLQRFDKASPNGPWRKTVLALIARHPAARAGNLAAELGWETQVLKIKVRKLKDLGLTISG